MPPKIESLLKSVCSKWKIFNQKFAHKKAIEKLSFRSAYIIIVIQSK